MSLSVKYTQWYILNVRLPNNLSSITEQHNKFDYRTTQVQLLNNISSINEQI